MNKPNRQFALLTFAGLGEVAAQELRLNSSFQIKRLRNHDLVVCSPGEQQTNDMAKLRSVEDIFLLLGEPVAVRSAADLKRLDRNLVSGSVLKALHVKNQMFSPDKPKRVTFKCFVKQDHDRRVQRRQIEAAVSRAILNAFPRWRVSDPAALELWAFYIEEHVWLGFRLTSESMRYHGREPAQRKGALRPSIAGAMITVASLAPGDVVMDPMCGSGGIVSELQHAAPATGITILAGDLDESGLHQAGRVAGDDKGLVSRWDATALPLGEAVVDCVICNLPYGRQYSTPQQLQSLYSDCISEWARVLSPSGRMILLTSQSTLLKQAIAKVGLTLVSANKVKVLGIWSTIHQVRTSYS